MLECGHSRHDILLEEVLVRHQHGLNELAENDRDENCGDRVPLDAELGELEWVSVRYKQV